MWRLTFDFTDAESTSTSKTNEITRKPHSGVEMESKNRTTREHRGCMEVLVLLSLILIAILFIVWLLPFFFSLRQREAPPTSGNSRAFLRYAPRRQDQTIVSRIGNFVRVSCEKGPWPN